MHSHLLPGIDDGSPDIPTSLLLLKGLQDLGIENFIATPHILWDIYKNTNETIEPALIELTATLRLENNPASVHAAAEYMMDDYFAQLLRSKMPLRCLRDNYVLVEFSFVNLPFDWKQLFFDMQIQGYRPVLAHPERYAFLYNQWDVLQEMLDMGVLLQVNLNSFTGYYGKQIQQQAKNLVKRKWISFLGSDLHHQRHLDALRSNDALMPQVEEVVASSLWIGFK